MMTRRMLVVFGMISEFLAAICIKMKIGTLLNATVLTMSCRIFTSCVFSAHSSHATVSFLFSDGISKSKERESGKFIMSQIFRKEEFNSLQCE